MPRPKDTERELSARRTRAALLSAAVDEFAQHGYRGANINRISTAAGFAKGTIYNHFSSKRELMQELIQAVAKQHYEYMARRILSAPGPQERLVEFFQAGFDYIREAYNQSRVIVQALHGPDQHFNNLMYQAYGPMFELIHEEILGPGIDQGVFQSMDVQQTAQLIMILYLGSTPSVEETGKSWLDPKAIGEFVSRALRAR